jgi:hypothetical protein
MEVRYIFELGITVNVKRRFSDILAIRQKKEDSYEYRMVDLLKSSKVPALANAPDLKA